MPCWQADLEKLTFIHDGEAYIVEPKQEETGFLAGFVTYVFPDKSTIVQGLIPGTWFAYSGPNEVLWKKLAAARYRCGKKRLGLAPLPPPKRREDK